MPAVAQVKLLLSSAFPSAEARLNVAVTALAADMVTTQVDVPLHAPDQPLKTEPPLGVAVKVTLAPGAKGELQVEPQLIPAGLLDTGPLPVPALATVRTEPRLNVAVTFLAALMDTTQVKAVPLHAPDHPAKTDPPLGAAVSVTKVPEAKLAAQVEPQLMPAGALLTGPLPVPAFAMVSA